MLCSCCYSEPDYRGGQEGETPAASPSSAPRFVGTQQKWILFCTLLSCKWFYGHELRDKVNAIKERQVFLFKGKKKKPRYCNTNPSFLFPALSAHSAMQQRVAKDEAGEILGEDALKRVTSTCGDTLDLQSVRAALKTCCWSTVSTSEVLSLFTLCILPVPASVSRTQLHDRPLVAVY